MLLDRFLGTEEVIEKNTLATQKKELKKLRDSLSFVKLLANKRTITLTLAFCVHPSGWKRYPRTDTWDDKHQPFMYIKIYTHNGSVMGYLFHLKLILRSYGVVGLP